MTEQAKSTEDAEIQGPFQEGCLVTVVYEDYNPEQRATGILEDPDSELRVTGRLEDLDPPFLTSEDQDNPARLLQVDLESETVESITGKQSKEIGSLSYVQFGGLPDWDREQAIESGMEALHQDAFKQDGPLRWYDPDEIQ
jgi:hypothetical protein